MADVVVARGERAELGAVQGDLRVDRDAVLDADASGRVTVSGDCWFRGNATVRAPIDCGGELRMRDGRIAFASDVRVGGTFRGDHVRAEVGGAFRAGSVDVDRELRFLGPAESPSFRVGGVLEASQALDGQSISVGGHLRALGRVRARKVDVGGEAAIETCELSALSVGGQARLGGGSVSELLEVGGHLEVTRPLEFGVIKVGGVARLGGGGKGRHVEIGGMFSSGGDLEFGTLEVGGMGRIDGNGSGESLELGGVLDVRGSLRLRGHMEVGGRAEVGGELEVASLDLGGELRASRLRASTEVHASGRLSTENGTFAAELTTGRNTDVRGPITAERVTIGRHGRAQSIFAGTVIVGPHSEVERIVADEVWLDRKCPGGPARVRSDPEGRQGRGIRSASGPDRVAPRGLRVGGGRTGCSMFPLPRRPAGSGADAPPSTCTPRSSRWSSATATRAGSPGSPTGPASRSTA